MRKKIKQWFIQNQQQKLEVSSKRAYTILLNYSDLKNKKLEILEVGKYNEKIILGQLMFDSRDMAQKFINDLGEEKLIKHFGKQIMEDDE